MRSLLCLLALWILPCEWSLAQAPASKKPAPPASKAKSDKTWPHPIPARIRDGSNKDLFVMTLGDVSTVLADGTFDPSKDEVTLKDGSVMSNYYRDTLRVKYYKPIDKSIFPCRRPVFAPGITTTRMSTRTKSSAMRNGSPGISRTTARNTSRLMTAGRRKLKRGGTGRGIGPGLTRLFRAAWPVSPPTSSRSA